MLWKLWRNGIITSAVEFYCLPCECHLRSTQDADLHVDNPVHRKALEATPYTQGYERDRIRKVPSGYYCEFCNVLFSTSSKVGLHITHSHHITSKAQQLLRRDGNTIIAFDNISITEKAWNGFRGQTCVVCSKDFVVENIHKSEKDHIIRLIQSKIEFGEGESIYREIDDGYIQCLTCNDEFLQDASQSHFNSAEHKIKYDESKIIITHNTSDKNENIKDQVKTEPVGENYKKAVDTSKETIKEKPQTDMKKDNEKPKIKKDTKNAIKGQSETQDPYDVDNKFRKVLNADDYIFDLDGKYCLLCESGVKEGKKLHLASALHMRLLKLHKERLARRKSSFEATVNNSNYNKSNENKIEGQESSEDEAESNGENNKTKNIDDNSRSDKILKSLIELIKGGIYVNFDSQVVYCTNCAEDLEFDYNFIINHIKEHEEFKKVKFYLNAYKDETKNTTLFSEPVLTNKEEVVAEVKNDEMNEYAKKHGLEFKNNLYHCGICEASMTVSLKQLKGHVTGSGHENRVRSQSQSKSITPEKALGVFANKVPMEEFINEFQQVENKGFEDAVINLKYCVNLLSFFMYTRYGSILRCQLCQTNFGLQDADIHKMEHAHQEKMNTTMVVTSIPDEFIREMQPNFLHCGYCNLALGESDMNNHLCSTSHKEVKRAMEARLQQYLPHIRGRSQADGTEAFLLILLNNVTLLRAARYGRE